MGLKLDGSVHGSDGSGSEVGLKLDGSENGSDGSGSEMGLMDGIKEIEII